MKKCLADQYDKLRAKRVTFVAAHETSDRDLAEKAWAEEKNAMLSPKALEDIGCVP